MGKSKFGNTAPRKTPDKPSKTSYDKVKELNLTSCVPTKRRGSKKGYNEPSNKQKNRFRWVRSPGRDKKSKPKSPRDKKGALRDIFNTFARSSSGSTFQDRNLETPYQFEYTTTEDDRPKENEDNRDSRGFMIRSAGEIHQTRTSLKEKTKVKKKKKKKKGKPSNCHGKWSSFSSELATSGRVCENEKKKPPPALLKKAHTDAEIVLSPESLGVKKKPAIRSVFSSDNLNRDRKFNVSKTTGQRTDRIADWWPEELCTSVDKDEDSIVHSETLDNLLIPCEREFCSEATQTPRPITEDRTSETSTCSLDCDTASFHTTHGSPKGKTCPFQRQEKTSTEAMHNLIERHKKCPELKQWTENLEETHFEVPTLVFSPRNQTYNQHRLIVFDAVGCTFNGNWCLFNNASRSTINGSNNFLLDCVGNAVTSFDAIRHGGYGNVMIKVVVCVIQDKLRTEESEETRR